MTDVLTPAEIAPLFEKLDVLRRGHFKLSSGKHSDTYLQCALALQSPAVALQLGASLADRLDVGDIDLVVSPALGGVLAGFAVAAALDVPFLFTERGADRVMTMRRGQQLEPGQRVLVVEDVVTTGGSAMEVVHLVEDAGATVVGLAALVDRSVGLPVDERPAMTPTALLTVDAQTWEQASCPACTDGVPLDAPGSRHTT